MKKIVLCGVVMLLGGCAPQRQASPLSDDAFLPPKGTPMKQVEDVYGNAQRVLPPDLKRPEEIHVYNVLPRLLLRVKYDGNKTVAWSEFLHLDAKHYLISAKTVNLTPEVIEHDRQVKERDMNELRKKIKELPWGT